MFRLYLPPSLSQGIHVTQLANTKLMLRSVRVVFWATLLFTFVCAEMPPGRAPHLFAWDKAEHFVAFYVLTFLAAAAFPRLRMLIVLLALSLFGAIIELVQALPFIHRDCDFWDWVADVAAICACLAPILLAHWRMRNAKEAI